MLPTVTHLTAQHHQLSGIHTGPDPAMTGIRRDIVRHLVFLVIIRILVSVTSRDLTAAVWRGPSRPHPDRDSAASRPQPRARDAAALRLTVTGHIAMGGPRVADRCQLTRLQC